MMDFPNLFPFLFFLSFTTIIPSCLAVSRNDFVKVLKKDTTSDDDFIFRKRNLKKGEGTCLATNPIDQCWRCQPDWAENRQKLADCAMGFGYQTTGGKGGPIYVVEDPSDDKFGDPKPGTLRHAITQKRPLWIIFKYDMAIKLQQELMVTSDKTIDGRGANVHIAEGARITLQNVKNVIIHNLHIHDIVKCHGPEGQRRKSDGDAISIKGSRNVWIDHISAWRAENRLIHASLGSTAITISNCHFAKHNEVMLLGSNGASLQDKRMIATVAYNHFGKELLQRLLRTQHGFFHIVNNDYTFWTGGVITGSANPTILSQGNRFDAQNSAATKEVTRRDNAPRSEWMKWHWVTQDDYFLNGATFKASTSRRIDLGRFNKRELIKHAPGTMASTLTRDAGTLNCVPGKPC